MSDKKILIVDDDQSILELLKTELEKEGYTVKTASNGESAVSKAKEFEPHLLIIDLVLPDMSGGEVAKAVRDQFGGQKIPFIFLTGMLTPQEAKDNEVGVQVGDSHYEAFAKPFDKSQLFSHIQNILNPNP